MRDESMMSSECPDGCGSTNPDHHPVVGGEVQPCRDTHGWHTPREWPSGRLVVPVVAPIAPPLAARCSRCGAGIADWIESGVCNECTAVDDAREALAHLLWHEQYVEWARGRVDLWETIPDYDKFAFYRMADAVLFAGYRLVSEDEKDTLRERIADAIASEIASLLPAADDSAKAYCNGLSAARRIARGTR